MSILGVSANANRQFFVTCIFWRGRDFANSKKSVGWDLYMINLKFSFIILSYDEFHLHDFVRTVEKSSMFIVSKSK